MARKGINMKPEIRVELEDAVKAAVELYRNYDGELVTKNRGAFILWQCLGGVGEHLPAKQYKPFVEQFYQQAEGFICDDNGELLKFSEFWAQFIDVRIGHDGKGKVKLFRKNSLVKAIARVELHKESLPEMEIYSDKPKIQRLGAVCLELALMEHPKPFSMSGENAGYILGYKNKRTAQEIGREVLNMFCVDGILERISKGHSGKNPKASTYHYLGNSFREENTDFYIPF